MEGMNTKLTKEWRRRREVEERLNDEDDKEVGKRMEDDDEVEESRKTKTKKKSK